MLHDSERGTPGRSFVLALCACLVVLVGCGGSAPARTGSLTHVVLETGFLPSMNSAPYYLAKARGYYKAQGLDVEVKDGSDPNLLGRVAQGQVDFGVTSGDALMLARGAGASNVMVLQQFQRSPVGAISLASSRPALTSPAALKGLRVGVSAPQGSTYFGLLALLQAAHLEKDDVQIISIGFTELESLLQKRVDVAMTYLNNEPVQARDQGNAVQTLPVGRATALVSTGLATSEHDVKSRPDLVRRFVAATLQGLRAGLSDPDAAYRATMARMPEATGDAARVQRDILAATQKYERPEGSQKLGRASSQDWAATGRLLTSVHATSAHVDPSACFTNRFVDGA